MLFNIQHISYGLASAMETWYFKIIEAKFITYFSTIEKNICHIFKDRVSLIHPANYLYKYSDFVTANRHMLHSIGVWTTGCHTEVTFISEWKQVAFCLPKSDGLLFLLLKQNILGAETFIYKTRANMHQIIRGECVCYLPWIMCVYCLHPIGNRCTSALSYTFSTSLFHWAHIHMVPFVHHCICECSINMWVSSLFPGCCS